MQAKRSAKHTCDGNFFFKSITPGWDAEACISPAYDEYVKKKKKHAKSKYWRKAHGRLEAV